MALALMGRALVALVLIVNVWLALGWARYRQSVTTTQINNWLELVAVNRGRGANFCTRPRAVGGLLRKQALKIGTRLGIAPILRFSQGHDN